MEWLNAAGIAVALLGLFAVVRFVSLMLGAFLSQMVTVAIVIVVAKFWTHTLAGAVATGSVAYFAGEFLLGYYSSLNLFRAPQNPGDSLRSILRYNFARNVYMWVLFPVFASVVFFVILPAQKPDIFATLSGWTLVASPPVRYVFIGLGMLFLLKGLSWITTASKLMR